MSPAFMHLKILLPFQVFAERTGVSKVVVETTEGSVGLLPHRLDCIAALVPGILLFGTENGEETYVAVDEGVLIKTGPDVFVSVRRATSGTSLSGLHELVENEFLSLDEREKNVRFVTQKMESDFIRRFAESHCD